MALFTQRRPRRFRYEANSALSQLSHNEDEQNNEPVSDDNDHKPLNGELKRGIFSSATFYLSRRQEKRRNGGLYLSTALCVLFIILLLVAWHLLVTG